MIRKFALAAAAVTLFAAPALADPIEGNWKTPKGTSIGISACGDAFCAVAKSGAHAGKTIGSMKATGNGNYKGSLTDLDENKTYKGRGKLAGNTLTMTGCVLGGLLCRSENWTR